MVKGEGINKKIDKAIDQEKDFKKRWGLENNECDSQTFEKISKELEETIVKFINKEGNKDLIPSRNVFKYNLLELYSLKGKELDNQISEFLINKLLPSYLINENIANNSLQYVFVPQRCDGMACVVGRSHFKIKSDVSNKIYLLDGTSSNDVGHLFKTIVIKDANKVKNETGISRIIYELLHKSNNDHETIKEKMKNYYAQAFVIPIIGGAYEASKIESLLGKELLDNGIQILDACSHTRY